MKATILIILVLVSTMLTYSQVVESDSSKIINSQFDSLYKVSVIPDNALQGEFDLLVTSNNKDLMKKLNENRIEISWTSYYIDGRYILVITPRQIYLRSNHDNPNPNYLYWLTSNTEGQYELIKHHLASNKSNIIHNYKSKKSSCLTYFFDKASEEKYERDNWTNKRYDNFQTLMNLINKPLLESGEKISIPSQKEFNKTKILRLVIDIEELQDQIKLIKIE